MSSKIVFITRFIMIMLLLTLAIASTSCGGSETLGFDVEDPSGDIIEDPDDGSTDPLADTDGDGILDTNDNCIYYSNADQADFDGDGDGDECDLDDDNDGVNDKSDACPNNANGYDDPDEDGLCGTDDNCEEDANADQADLDADGMGDICDTDDDNDGYEDTADNCPELSNDQSDIDGDGLGDACDDDIDGDGILDDGDGSGTIGDNTCTYGNTTNCDDNCYLVENADQADTDGDGIGNECEDDTDGDGILDDGDGSGVAGDNPCTGGFYQNCDDNCIYRPNHTQGDVDMDTVGNACDNCPGDANEDQENFDGDRWGDVCDLDIDGDGAGNLADGDCDEYDENFYPGAPELFDLEDTDCDGSADIAYSLTNATFTIDGEAANDQLGHKVTLINDVNGDGCGDIITSAPENDELGSYSGRVYLYFGCKESFTGSIAAEDADVIFTAESNGDYLGYSIADAGDVNADGLNDILIGARWNDDGGNKAGKIYLIYGRDFEAGEEFDLSDADAKFVGANAGDYLGFTVASAGDVDADGYADIVFGGKGYDSNAGIVYLFSGSYLASQTWTTNVSLNNAEATYTGEDTSDEAGKALASAGDFNNDGYDDFIIGAPGHTGGSFYTGKVYIIYGGSDWVSGTHDLGDSDLENENRTYRAEASGDYLGNYISGGVDINGDDIDDIIVGAYAHDDGYTNNGAAYVIYGSDTTLTGVDVISDADVKFIGEADNDYAGRDVKMIAKIDGSDGMGEIMIGAAYNDDVNSQSGKVYIYRGDAGFAGSITLSDATADATILGIGTGTDEYAGYSISGGVDINGDEGLDFLIGAYGTTNGSAYGLLTY